MTKGNLKGIGLFQMQILHLISIGKKENLETIEQHMYDGDLIEYIFNKYSDDFYVPFDNNIYDNKTLNSFFQKYVGGIEGNEDRKYGIMNNEDGLLIILAFIGEKTERASIEWTIE